MLNKLIISREDVLGMEMQIHVFVALDGGQFSASRSGRFTVEEESRYTLTKWLNGPQNPV
jgi:hypothetical protein